MSEGAWGVCILAVIAVLAGCGSSHRASPLEYQCDWTIMEQRDINIGSFETTIGLHGKRRIMYPLCWKPATEHRPTLVINHRETWPEILHMSVEWSRCLDDLDFGFIKSVNACQWSKPGGWSPPWPKEWLPGVNA